MVLTILRALFVLLMAAVGWFFLSQQGQGFGQYTFLTLTITLILSVAIICIDILSPRRKLAIFSGTFLGLLVGILIAFALSFVIRLLVDQVGSMNPTWQKFLGTPVESISNADTDARLTASVIPVRTYGDVFTNFLQLTVGIACCYLAISFVLQTKDDFRFIIPYVEFSRKSKGSRPTLIDTSVLIDGRINDVVGSGFLEGQLIVPRFVLDELQAVADSNDKLKRNRGRRGLDMLTKLQANRRAEVILYDASIHASGNGAMATGVDQKLLLLAKQLEARILTTDFNLNKVAQLQGVSVLNLNDLNTALRPLVLPGERLLVRLAEPGEQAGQGVGYLADGTMVVIEGGADHLNEEVDFTVANVVQTSAGRLVFGRLGDAPQIGKRPRSRTEAPSNTPSSSA